jgi:hypothetical protein
MLEAGLVAAPEEDELAKLRLREPVTAGPDSPDEWPLVTHRPRPRNAILLTERIPFSLNRQDFLRRDGKVADAEADRVIDSTGDGGRYAGRCEFTDALGAQRT